ncbi:thermonuclease family protein [Halobacillus karajensis]|uniref:SPBc2 prophage-derived endonuclease YokF n=1 Tax=Halobacillus karajensis TaxID=195088 RepID=A0A024P759_9BACI|nr:thermonuclease family protein [Halobacillus karajensis]CDQ20957.1 SPBc2 prophage-derived endonuclease YokF precursor [Halobacillus karajensis]CDQ24979.1 SPBc2 prophage-derived endonuclease YokF precursor [Halobacillus karajensis]CDQ28660.1 SPBc2 prophage-derived endonuclease YokF precursor [Halobacillus karajensis]
MTPWNRPVYWLLLVLVMLFPLLTSCATETQPAEKSNDHIEQHEKLNTEKEENQLKETKDASKEAEVVKAMVTNVVDGDTIDIQINGKEERVRLLLVDTPETVHPNKPVQPFGPEASHFVKQKLDNKEVRIEYDGPKRDKYDRLLAYVWVDGENFNQQLLEKGLARYAYVYNPPYTHADSMQEAESRAQQQEKGVWSIDGYVTEDGFLEEAPINEEPASTDDKGNLPYDPYGSDRDCSDFSSQEEAQAFYEAAGGPKEDPHRLDGNDNDGIVCENL